MTNLLHKLHQKPEHHRKSLALGISFVVTLMIFGIWASTLPGRLSDVTGVAKENQKELENKITPLATVKSSFDEIKKSIDEFRGIVGPKEIMLETVVGQ